MGKKGKKANKKSSSRNANSSSSSKSNSNATGIPFCVPDPEEPTTTNYIDRPIPDSSLGHISYLSNLEDRLNHILSSNRETGSLPTNVELSKLKSKTAKRVATALSRFEIAKCYIQMDYLCNLSENIEMAKPLQVSMQKLLHKDSFLQACVHIVAAMSSTDTRLSPCNSSICQCWPMPTSYRMPVEYYPLNQGEIQMPDMTHEEFIILLATTLTVGTTTLISGQDVLRMVHELCLQAENMDWSKFESRKHLNPLTENSCRNALAGIGIQACRRLFRMDKTDRCAGEVDMKLSSKTLLREIELFARDQMKYSKSGNGEFNMAWIAQQSSAVLKVDPLCAAADALHWYTKAYKAADKYGNDFVSGVARIEAAFCLSCCGEGVLKIPTPVHDMAFVRRDFRTEFGEKKEIRLDEKTKQGYSLFFIDILDAIDRQHANFAHKYEIDRLTSGKPITVLTKEEGHFIHVH